MPNNYNISFTVSYIQLIYNVSGSASASEMR